jgi:hypothetical protein
MPPLGDRGREPGGVVAANRTEAAALVRYGRLDIEEAGDCKSVLSLVRGSLVDGELAATEGDCPRGAPSLIDVMKADRPGCWSAWGGRFRTDRLDPQFELSFKVAVINYHSKL